MFSKDKKKKKVNGVIGKDCCRVTSGIVIKKEKSVKIYTDIYTYLSGM